MRLSIIIPVLNEAAEIAHCLSLLQAYRNAGHELILADGGSIDAVLRLAQGRVDKIIHAERGRARQMNAAAEQARGDVLLFLHADTRLPENADRLIREALETGRIWGRFDVRLSGQAWSLRVIETLMNWRSCLSGIATGDQAMFVLREAFVQLGGFADIPLMEDIELSRRLKKISAPCCLRTRVITSSRRWETQGILRTVLLMWGLRLAWFLGVSAARLQKIYYR
ncbi:Glycosyl transferase, family 2 [hydrothermal vent metagenome]|uniref:Glycosyl transferase, family 2 n=1 Tax=hydrothermal vent metagenome TaxID=652676 RepID=A0A3B1C6K0_9ZZZZ